ncbi:MAG TPA: ABATE domain-containing protein [Dongiaceae bacterium]|jgi:predicted RNA-binding Zn ribbon-like protein|nr:ABATE domain-containing protein [Dongiaceae bacterium]
MAVKQDGAKSIRSLSKGRAGRLPLVGGRLCLNFVNTSSGRGTPARKEHLTSYHDLLAWSHHAGALDATVTLALAALAGRQAQAARRTLSKAIKLRESLFAIVTGLARRQPPAPAALEELNGFLAASYRAACLAQDGHGFRWIWRLDTLRLDLPVWIIARSASEVLTGEPLERLKSCAGLDCGWVFLDATRNGRRRWCEMEVCGSRAKMRRYRHRHQSRAARISTAHA